MNASCIYHDPAQLVDQLGAATAANVAAFGRDAITTISALIRDQAIDCDLEPAGLAYPAMDSAQMLVAQKMFRASESIGFAGELWSAETCKKQLGSDLFIGAFVDTTAFHVNPYKLARGLLTKVVRPSGVDVYEHSAVNDIRDNGQFVTAIATSSQGRFRICAKSALIATNAYTIHSPERRYFAPLHVYSIVTEPLTDEQLHEMGWHGRQVIRE